MLFRPNVSVVSVFAYLLSTLLVLSWNPASAAPVPDTQAKLPQKTAPAPLGADVAANQTIIISGRGLTPNTLNLFGPGDVSFENRSGVTVTLRSGTPTTPGHTLYLPTVVNSDGRRARVISRVRNQTVDFAVTLGPGDVFVQRYSAPGEYHVHLTEPPQAGVISALLGQITVTGTGLLSTSPQDGEDGVAVTRETVLTFSAPLDPATVTKSVFSASSAGAALDFRLHLSKDRRQVTLFYAAPLPGNARVQVNVDGAALRDESGGLVDVDGDNVAGGATGLTFTTLSLATVAGTSVCGRVFASQLAASGNTSVNEPLQGATITVDGKEQEMRAVTDAAGNFCLDPAPAGRFFVHIDGRTAGNATPEGGYYPFVGKAWESIPGSQTSIGDVYLPLVEPGTLQPVSQTEDVTVGFAPSVLAVHPEFANVSITVPAGSLFNDDGTPGGKVGIAPVPPDRLPGQLPEALKFPLVITVQTDGATNFDTPAPVCFPNLPNPDTGQKLAPGEKTALWSFNHDTGRFGVVGPMTANADASLICTDPGVGVPAPGWHGWNPGVPARGGPSYPDRPPSRPPPPPPEDEEECEPGKKECKPRENYQPNVNGCGPQPLIDATGDLTIYNNPVLVHLPTNPLVGSGCDFRPSCNTHDVGYGTCNSDKTHKTQVDNTFLSDMQAACDACYSAINLPGKTACYAAAAALYQAVSNLGDRFYDAAQNEACECEQCPANRAGAERIPPWLEPAGIDASTVDEGQLLTGLTYYRAVNLNTGEVQRGEAGRNGVAFERDIVLAPNTPYRLFLLHAETLHEDYMDILTPGSGQALELPPFYLYENLGYDLDEDGLAALGEAIMGTDPADADSDDDGVLDGVEVQAGQNPLSGVLVQTGIIASADTPGNAVDVCISGDVAAVADGDPGVAIFNVFAGMNPQILAQVDTPGSAGAVACDGSTVVVADGSAGLAVIDVSNPATPALSRQVDFAGVRVWSVTAANGKAYVGLADGRLAQVNLADGNIDRTVQVHPPDSHGLEIQDVALAGDFLHLISVAGLTTIHLDSFSAVAFEPSFSEFSETASRQRIAAGAGQLYGTTDISADLFRAHLPPHLQRLGDLNLEDTFGWNHAIPNGAGRVLAASAPAPDSPADQWQVSVFNVTDPLNPSFVTGYDTPGLATALALDKGLLYVSDQDAGIQVINFQAADTVGVTPTVTLESNFAAGRFQNDVEMRLTALAEDDIQVRDVAFYLNGQLLQTDGSFPFEIRFTPPATSTLILQAKATDTGGKFAWSDVQTRTAVSDAVMPEVLTYAPGRAEKIAQEDLVVQAGFSEAMDPASLTPASVQLVDASGQPVAGGAVSYDAVGMTATLTFATPPAPGVYTATLSSSVQDAAGNPLPVRAWPLEVTETLSGKFVTFSDDSGSFLSAVDLHGDWLVVGASQATVNGNARQGAAYLFTRDSSAPSGWREVKKLTASDGAAGDEFGRAVAVSDDTVIVGAPNKELTSRNMGQVYVFARNQGGPDNWGEVARFADAVGSSRFNGSEVAIEGDTFVAVPSTIMKTAYLYRRSGAGATDWALLKAVPLDDSVQNFRAGEAIALSQDEQTLVASVPRLSIDANNRNEGVVRIFQQDEGGANNWGQTGQIQAGDPAEDAYFGGDLALHGNVLAVGAPFHDASSNAEGKLYIFLRDGSAPQGWRQVAAFDEPETFSSVRTLGNVVDAAQNIVVAVGASNVYVYRPVNGNPEQWSRVILWQAANESAASFFNGIVAVDGTTLVTTASLADSGAPALFFLEVEP